MAHISHSVPIYVSNFTLVEVNRINPRLITVHHERYLICSSQI
nr:MAG TPA: hypothetical protein [Crassvirales sp.]